MKFPTMPREDEVFDYFIDINNELGAVFHRPAEISLATYRWEVMLCAKTLKKLAPQSSITIRRNFKDGGKKELVCEVTL